MQTKRSARSATIFSRVSAAPPPLIMCPRGSISSAPSMYTGMRSTRLLSSTGMPWARRRSLLFSLLDTAPAISPRRLASASMKQLTVEPVPTPTTLPGTTWASAAWPTSTFNSSWVMEGGSFETMTDYQVHPSWPSFPTR